MDDRIKSLSPKAKEVLDRIVKVNSEFHYEIFSRSSQSPFQLREEEHEILHTMTPETAKELYGLI